MLSIHRWLRVLGVKQDHCEGIMAVIGVQSQIVRMKLVTNDLMQSFLNAFLGKRLEIKDGNECYEVRIKEAGLNERYVRIADIPFETELETVEKSLEKYGKIISIKRDYFKPIESEEEIYFEVPSGWITVAMVIEKDIPSYLEVDGTRAVVKYRGQPKTCRICSQSGHIAYQCPKKAYNSRRGWENASEISKNENQRKNKESNLNTVIQLTSEAQQGVRREVQPGNSSEESGIIPRTISNFPSIVETPDDIQDQIQDQSLPQPQVGNIPTRNVDEERMEEENQLPSGASEISPWNSFDLNKIEKNDGRPQPENKEYENDIQIEEDSSSSDESIKSVAEEDNQSNNKRPREEGKKNCPTKSRWNKFDGAVGNQNE